MVTENISLSVSEDAEKSVKAKIVDAAAPEFSNGFEVAGTVVRKNEITRSRASVELLDILQNH